jgi:hypothetical protein
MGQVLCNIFTAEVNTCVKRKQFWNGQTLKFLWYRYKQVLMMIWWWSLIQNVVFELWPSVGGYQRFGWAWCLHLQGRSDNGGSIFLRNIGNHLQDHTVSTQKTRNWTLTGLKISNLYKISWLIDWLYIKRPSLLRALDRNEWPNSSSSWHICDKFQNVLKGNGDGL